MSNLPPTGDSPFSPGDGTSPPSNIGSLAQSARKKQLKTAKYLLLFIGGLSIVANVALIFLAENMIDAEIQKEIEQARRQGMVVDQGAVQQVKNEALQAVRIGNGVGAGLGLVFVLLGLNIYIAPVPITITALVLYVGAAAVFGILDPTTLLRGLIIKIIIVVCLFKAVSAAIAYENERQSSSFA